MKSLKGIQEKRISEKNKKRKNEKHESGVTLKWAIPNSLSTEAKNRFFRRENRHFYNKNFSTIFCGFWRLLGRLEKEKNETLEHKEKKEKNVQRKNQQTTIERAKMKKNGKTKENEKC